MKVVVLHPAPYPVNIRFYSLLAAYVDLTLYIFSEYPSGHEAWHFRNWHNDDIPFKVRLLGKGVYSWRYVASPRFLRCFREDAPDLVMTIAFSPFGFYAALFKKLFGYKMSLLTNATAVTESGRSRLRTLSRGWLLNRCDGTIGATRESVDYLRSLGGSGPCYLSRQTSDITRIMAAFDRLPAKRRLREELQLPPGKIVLIGVGSLIPRKNWDALFPLLKNDSGLHLLLVGSGDEEERYRRVLAEMALEARVTFAGRREEEELLRCYKAADIFVLPTLLDQFGFVVTEALAATLPVICSRNAGASCLITDGENGYTFDPYNGEELAAVTRLACRELGRLRRNTRASVAACTLENRAAEFDTIYRDILDNGGERG